MSGYLFAVLMETWYCMGVDLLRFSCGVVPRFTHDCDHDTYLGSYDHDAYLQEWHPVVDLWIHTPTNEWPETGSLIYRYSDEGQDYGSMPLSHVLQLAEELPMRGAWEVYFELLRRAQKMELVEYEILSSLPAV